MYETDELIVTSNLSFTLSKDTVEVDDGEYRVAPLQEECDDGHLHQVAADVNVVNLYVFQLLRELRLLLHIASLLLTSSLTHFLANVIHMILTHRVVIFE